MTRNDNLFVDEVFDVIRDHDGVYLGLNVPPREAGQMGFKRIPQPEPIIAEKEDTYTGSSPHDGVVDGESALVGPGGRLRGQDRDTITREVWIKLSRCAYDVPSPASAATSTADDRHAHADFTNRAVAEI